MKEINIDVKEYDGSTEHFLTWKRKIELKFTAAGKAYLLLNPKERTEENKKPEEAEDLIQACAAIKLTLTGKPERDTDLCQTPFAIIELLKNKYHQVTKMSMFREITSLTKMKLNENENVEDYLKKFDEKKETLRQCGFDTALNPDDLFKTFLLASLPPSFESMVGGIVNDLQNETYEQIFNKILNKSILSNNSKIINPLNASANLISTEKKLCTSCNRYHFGPCALECPKCKKKHYGHNKCNVSTKEERINKDVSNYFWCIDSGANISVSNSTEKFKTLFASSGDIGVACKHGRLDINGIGDVILKTICGKSINLCNVIYSSNASRNIISVHDLTKLGFNVIFTKSGWKVTQSDNSVFLSGKILDGLYILETSNPEVNSVIKSSTYDVWHKRMGHPGKITMKTLKEKCPKELKNVTIEDSVCQICMEGKGTKLPHSTTATKATRPYIRVHSDIWGPASSPDRHGNKYYVSFTDDYSGYASIYLMKDKSEVEKHYLLYSRHIKNLNKGVGITFLRSDNGMEYKSTTFQSILTLDGTKQEFSAPYCQQENGTSERLNRTLLEKTRCLMFESKCPHYLWGDAVGTACYLYNRIPQLKRGASPYELWTGKVLDLKHIKTFGSVAFANIPVKLTGGKFNKRASQGRMIGYSSNAKMYLLWNEQKRIEIETRDVIFDEADHIFTSGKLLKNLRELREVDKNEKDLNEIKIPTEINKSKSKTTDREIEDHHDEHTQERIVPDLESESENESSDDIDEDDFETAEASSFDMGSSYEEESNTAETENEELEENLPLLHINEPIEPRKSTRAQKPVVKYGFANLAISSDNRLRINMKKQY